MRPLSVVIPAHNEEQVIDRCLRALLEGAEPGEVEVIVACNGCTDATAERAGAHGVTVLEVDEASKVAALNAGDAAASHFPRFYVDADVELPVDVLRRVAAELEGEILCAAPRPRFEVRDRPWAIRAFYDIWQRLPFLNDEPVGNGVYALSAAGRSRFERFPALTGDDLFIRNLFRRDERRMVRDASFVIHTPTSLRGLLNIRVRVHRGNRELHRTLDLDPQHGARSRGLLDLVRQPRLLPAVAVYVGINAVARLLGTWRDLRGSSTWERDDSARAAAS